LAALNRPGFIEPPPNLGRFRWGVLGSYFTLWNFEPGQPDTATVIGSGFLEYAGFDEFAGSYIGPDQEVTETFFLPIRDRAWLDGLDDHVVDGVDPRHRALVDVGDPDVGVGTTIPRGPRPTGMLGCSVWVATSM
jgi:hypothetical protein